VGRPSRSRATAETGSTSVMAVEPFPSTMHSISTPEDMPDRHAISPGVLQDWEDLCEEMKWSERVKSLGEGSQNGPPVVTSEKRRRVGVSSLDAASTPARKPKTSIIASGSSTAYTGASAVARAYAAGNPRGRGSRLLHGYTV
jgi:hypothetical protein